MTKDVLLNVNGEPRPARASGATTLLHVLREQFHLTGTKSGCGYGVCGACSVLIDGKPARSCLTLAAMCEGQSITTIEGVASSGGLDLIQQSMLDCGAVQCGFCTPGIVITAKALLEENPKPTREEIRGALAGNICRCSGYVAIVDAISAAAEASR